jgi:hypothetical protein
MIFQFKTQLEGITKPPVWRTVTVPSDFSFYRFHIVIQEAFGWENCHLYQFSPNGYGSSPTIKESIPGEEEYDDDNAIEASETKLSEIFTAVNQKFTYIYDFGDSWEHKIVLEKIIDANAIKANCIAGKGACPPEDCGGIPGYAGMLETLSDPSNPGCEEMKDWLGLDEDEEWDVNYFDLEEARITVRLI